MTTDFVDRIGQRLDDPENVPAHLAHLIPDDVQRVKRILEFPVSGRVLDVGCSDGSITRRIAEKWGTTTLGIDVNPPSGWPLNRGAFALVPWDIREPVPRDWWEPFDAAYACEVFEHLTDADANKAMENICAVLKPGGSLVLTVPNRHPADIYEVGCRSRWAWPDHRSSYTADKLWNWLGHWGFGEWEPTPLYDGERFEDSIWLIARAKSRR